MKIIDIVKIISEKHHSQSTGALFLLDENKKLVQIYFQEGDLVAVKSRNLTGRDALNELMTLKPIKFQFHDGAGTKSTDNIPSTPNIIDMLSDVKDEQEQMRLLSMETEDKIRDLFTEYVGPIADVIFEEQVEKSISLDNLINILSSYIDDDADKTSFAKKAHSTA